MKKVSVKDMKKNFSKGTLLGCAAFVLLLIIDTVHCFEIESLKEQVEQGNATYVYDVNKIIAGSPVLLELRKSYELQMADLNKQIDAANKKLAGMKDKAAKAEYSEVYLASLKAKRDNAVEAYQASIQSISDKVNNALLSVVDSKGINVVFDVKSIAVKTPKVIDITDEVLQNTIK